MTEEQWVAIYRETLRPLYRYVSRRTGADRDLAEDVTQESWLRALKAWPDQGLPDKPLAWLQTVARNLLASYYRKLRPQLSSSAAASAVSLDDVSRESETAELIHWGIHQLHQKQRELIEAFHFDQRSLREIAAESSVSERAIEGRLYRARAELESILGRKIRTEERHDGAT